MPKFVLAADIGGTKIAAARVDASGKITHQVKAATPPEGGNAVTNVLVELLRRLPQSGVCALAIDVPGLVYPDGSVWAPNIRGWARMPLRKILRRSFHSDVLIESDRNACVTGEAWRGAAHGSNDVVFLAVGTGIGAGIISGGRLLRGHAGLAGCAGWMAIHGQFLPEYQSIGCLEAHAAGPAIGRAARREFKREMTAQEVVRLARQGDKKARKILHQAGEDLGRGIANLVSILNPQVIVIGGGVAAAGELLLAPARQAVKRWAQPLGAKQARIVRSRLGERAALLGAAKLAMKGRGL